MEKSNRSRKEIRESLNTMRQRVTLRIESLTKGTTLSEYAHLVKENENGYTVWTEALQRAIDEYEIIEIPSGVYYVDRTIVIPSNRKILCYGAHIKKVPEMNTLLFRNEHLRDGSDYAINGADKDENISILGGIFEDTGKEWTFHHGLYDKENSMPGVSACFCFTNITSLYISDVKIIKAGGFGIQLGYLTDGIIENISFENTVADGVHINGNTKNLILENISGSVGDDIVALNMYDWSASSVSFGPIENVAIENINLAPESRYKAIRILPGKYYYKNGEVSDCYIKDVIIKGVRGVNTFKMYFQTPPYPVGEKSEAGESGFGDNLFFEDIELDLYKPIDAFSEYLTGDEVLGTFAAFELGSHIGKLELSDIKLKLYKDKYPSSYLLSIGPKSIRRDGKEIFDPYLNSTLEELILKNIMINSDRLSSENSEKYIKEIVFKNLYGEKSGRFSGKIKKIRID